MPTGAIEVSPPFLWGTRAIMSSIVESIWSTVRPLSSERVPTM